LYHIRRIVRVSPALVADLQRLLRHARLLRVHAGSGIAMYTDMKGNVEDTKV